MSSVTPTVGRIVHVFPNPSRPGQVHDQPLAGIITQVYPYPLYERGTVRITVFHPDGTTEAETMRHSEDGTPGTWTWPAVAPASGRHLSAAA